MITLLIVASLYVSQHVCVEAFVPTSTSVPRSSSMLLNLKNPSDAESNKPSMPQVVSTILSVGVIGTSIIFPNAAFADEIGRETEAPTLYTGEIVEVSSVDFSPLVDYIHLTYDISNKTTFLYF